MSAHAERLHHSTHLTALMSLQRLAVFLQQQFHEVFFFKSDKFVGVHIHY